MVGNHPSTAQFIVLGGQSITVEFEKGMKQGPKKRRRKSCADLETWQRLEKSRARKSRFLCWALKFLSFLAFNPKDFKVLKYLS